MGTREGLNRFASAFAELAIIGQIVAGCATGEIVMPEVTTEPEEEVVTKTFTAEFEPQTRTSISIADTVGSVKWVEGDAISILQGHTNTKVVLKASDITDDGAKARFTISVKPGVTYCAVYPYSTSNSFWNGNLVTVQPPAEQDGSFGGCHVSSAEFDSTYKTITFQNISNIITFTKTSSDIARITFEDNSGNDILKGSSSIDVVTGSGDQFFIGLPDCTLAQGFTITAFDSSDNCIGMAFSANSLTLKEAAGVNLGNLDDHLIPVVAINGFSELGEGAECVLIGTVVGLGDSTFSISDGTGTLDVPNISGLSVSVGDLVTIRGSKAEDTISDAVCLSHKANDSFLSQSAYGAYSLSQSTAYHSYKEFLDQIGVGEGTFRVVNPNSTKWLSVTGLPSDPVVGSKCTVQVEQNYSSSLSSSFSTQVTIVKVEDDTAPTVPSAKKVWLITSAGQGLVVRINQ